jgi:hypothetical protein
VSQFILVREVVANLTVKRLLECVSEALCKVLRRRPDGHFTLPTSRGCIGIIDTHNPGEWIIFAGAIRLIAKQVLDLGQMKSKESTVEVDVTTRDSGSFSPAGRTNDLLWWTEMGMLLTLDRLTRTCPPPIGIDVTAVLTDCRLGQPLFGPMAPCFVVNAFREGLIGIFFHF